MLDKDSDTAPPSSLEPYLTPGQFVDSDDPDIIAFAEDRTKGALTDVEKAVRLYDAVRDEVLYDPYMPWAEDEAYKASTCLRKRRGFCVPKAALLAACARAVGIPSRITFADVRNHLCTPRLRELMGTDVFTYHGITELYLDRRWLKVTPTFNLSLCERFGVFPLEFDGVSDALFHPYDKTGRRHMEYLRYHESYADVPSETVRGAMIAAYGADAGAAAGGGNFSREAEPVSTAK